METSLACYGRLTVLRVAHRPCDNMLRIGACASPVHLAHPSFPVACTHHAPSRPRSRIRMRTPTRDPYMLLPPARPPGNKPESPFQPRRSPWKQMPSHLIAAVPSFDRNELIATAQNKHNSTRRLNGWPTALEFDSHLTDRQCMQMAKTYRELRIVHTNESNDTRCPS